MLPMNYYIGLDAHSQTCTAVVVDENGDQKLRQTFDTTEANLIGFVSRVKGDNVSLTFEECTLSQWLYLTLVEHVDHLLVCNPVYVAKKQGAKTDYRDALHLAHELRTGHLKPVFHEKSHWIELRTLTNNYLALVGDIVSAKNRLKAVFRSEAVDTNTTNFYTDKERVKDLKNKNAQFVADSLYQQVAGLEKLKLEYKDKFEKNRKKYRPIRNLCTVPGIDLIRATIIMATVCQPQRFRNKHQFWGYSMLVRHIQMSGGKIYGNRRVHGRRELRDVFLGAAESALRTETSLRDYYEALRAKGTPHKEAKISLARKIAATCLCILKNNDTFKGDYDLQQTERTKLRKELNLENV
jgi:transposase